MMGDFRYRNEPRHVETLVNYLTGVFGVGREGTHTHIGHFSLGIFTDGIIHVCGGDSRCCDRINRGNRSYLQQTSGKVMISCKKCNKNQEEMDLDFRNRQAWVVVRTYYGLVPHNHHV
jgi:hypothetical protein